MQWLHVHAIVKQMCTCTGLLVISRRTKKEQSRPWAFSLQGCSVMLGAAHSCQLAVHSIDGAVYLRALTASDREEWLQAITASAANFDLLVRKSQCLGPGTAAGLTGDQTQNDNQSALDKKVRFTAAMPTQFACLAFGP
jgi:hypothetical protein